MHNIRSKLKDYLYERLINYMYTSKGSKYKKNIWVVGVNALVFDSRSKTDPWCKPIN